MIIIQHEFYEKPEYPIMVHRFYGETLEQAKRIFKAHARYDVLIRCMLRLEHDAKGKTAGVFNDIPFRSVIRVVRE